MVKWIVVLAGSLLICQLSLSQSLNFEAIDQYWVIADSLQKNKEVSENVWKAYFNVYANQHLIKIAKEDTNMVAYKEGMRIAFMPSRQQELKEILKIPKNEIWQNRKHGFAGLMYKYKFNQDGLKEYLKTLRSGIGLNFMYEQAYTMLPDSFRTENKRVPGLNIYYYAIFGGASALKEGIFFDLLSSYEYDKHKAGILGGHELHHLLRPQLIIESAGNDKAIIYGLELLLNEGSADLISNPPVIDKIDFENLKSWIFQDSDSILRAFDEIICRVATKSQDLTISINDIKKLFKYSGGHNPGYFMAATIDKNGWRSKIIQHINDPFEFALLYQKAVKRDSRKLPAFNSESIRYLKKMKEKYVTAAKKEVNKIDTLAD